MMTKMMMMMMIEECINNFSYCNAFELHNFFFFFLFFQFISFNA